MLGVIIKNEFFKLSKQKKPLVFLLINIFFIFLSAFAVSKVSSEIKTDDAFKMIIIGMYQVIVIFGILIISESITEDCKNGTIKISAVQPISRSSIVLGKLIYAAITIVIMYLVVALLSFIATSIFIGIPSMNMVGEVLKGIGLSSIVLISFMSIIGVLAVLFTAPSLVTSIGIAIFFLSDIILNLLPLIKWIPKNTKYFLVTNYFVTFFNDLPDVTNIKLYATIAIAAPLVLCVFGAIKLFQRKELNY